MFPLQKSTAGDRNRTGTVLLRQDFKSCASASSATPACVFNSLNTMDGEGFEPSKAVPTDLQSAPFGHSGIHPFIYRRDNSIKSKCLSRFTIVSQV